MSSLDIGIEHEAEDLLLAFGAERCRELARMLIRKTMPLETHICAFCTAEFSVAYGEVRGARSRAARYCTALCKSRARDARRAPRVKAQAQRYEAERAEVT